MDNVAGIGHAALGGCISTNSTGRDLQPADERSAPIFDRVGDAT
jgi:hypothetical protein